MSWQLFDRIRGMTRSGGIYQQEQLFQNQSSIDKIVSGGEFYDFSQQKALLDQTNIQINRLERYKDYDQADEVGEISLALDLYADEASLVDPERKHTVIVKAKTKRVKEALEELFFNQLLIDNNVRPMIRYLCKFGDCPHEIVPDSNRSGVAAIKFMNVYNFTRVETKHGDLVGFFHQDELTEAPIFLHPWQVMHLRLTSYENLFAPYGRSIVEGSRRSFKQLRLMEDAALIYRVCLRGDTLISTPVGHKAIRDLKIDDIVYSYTVEGKLKTTKVARHYCNGNDRIFRIASRHREIFANATHPILVEYKSGTTLVQEYVDVRDLVPHKHRLITPQYPENSELVKLVRRDIPRYIRLNEAIDIGIGHTSLGMRVGLKWDSVTSFLNGTHDLIEGRADCLMEVAGIDPDRQAIEGWCYNSNDGKATSYDIPEHADEDFARWFGFMIGDGFVSRRSNGPSSYISQVGFALGDDEDTNNRYKLLFEKIVGEVAFGGDQGYRLGSYYVYSTHLVDFMLDNGFVPGAANKRIPKWVYESPRDIQEAFIDGYIDADGWRRMYKGGKTEGNEVECCNRALLEDLKELIHRLGWTAGLVRERHRENGHEIEPGRIMGPTDGWCFYFTKNPQPASEKIITIGEVDNSDVYDITVEADEHNFIGNGICLSNTRAPEKRIFKIPVGQIPSKEVPEYIQSIARTFKNKRFYDPRTGTFNERYAPLIQEDDFFLPQRPDGTGPTIDTLDGAANLDQIADIDYFKKKMVAPLKIPFARVGIGDGAGSPSGKLLITDHPEFAKAVQWVQREVTSGLTKVAICHLAMRGFSIDEIKSFSLSMSATNAIDELYRMETWSSRVSVMSDLKDLEWFPKEWIVGRFTDLSPDEIREITSMPVDEGGNIGGNIGGGMAGGLDDLLDGGDNLDIDNSNDSDESDVPEIVPELGDIPIEDSKQDIALEKHVLTEARKAERRRKVKKLLNTIGESKNQVDSQYQYLLDNNEFDGLSKGNDDDKEVIVECADDNSEVIKEFREFLEIAT